MTDLAVTSANVVISESKTADNTIGIAIRQTSPSSITFHRIEDHELEMLTNIVRPISLAISTMAIGAFIGLIPSGLAIFDKVKTATVISLTDAVTLCVWVACGVLGLVVGMYAARGQINARETLKNIRSRPVTPIGGST